MKVNQKANALPSVVEHLAALGASLRAHRMLKRLTHEEVAQSCGFSRQTLSRIERGDPSVAIGQIVRYAEVVGAHKALSLKMPAKAAETQRRVRHSRKELAQLSAPTAASAAPALAQASA